eukprot:SAG31_NODE_18379_length_638_cov_1.244898_1_plen_165_part_01
MDGTPLSDGRLMVVKVVQARAREFDDRPYRGGKGGKGGKGSWQLPEPIRDSDAVQQWQRGQTVDSRGANGIGGSGAQVLTTGGGSNGANWRDRSDGPSPVGLLTSENSGDHWRRGQQQMANLPGYGDSMQQNLLLERQIQQANREHFAEHMQSNGYGRVYRGQGG